MITINKKVKISKDNQQVIFDLENRLPEGEYEVELVINENGKIKTGKDFSLENWHKNGLKLNRFHTFNRDELYGDDEK